MLSQGVPSLSPSKLFTSQTFKKWKASAQLVIWPHSVLLPQGPNWLCVTVTVLEVEAIPPSP
jgi:hypothetical protein